MKTNWQRSPDVRRFFEQKKKKIMVVAPTAHIITLKGNARTKQVKILILISLPRMLVNLREKKKVSQSAKGLQK
jgi:hypothetical protein